MQILTLISILLEPAHKNKGFAGVGLNASGLIDRELDRVESRVRDLFLALRRPGAITASNLPRAGFEAQVAIVVYAAVNRIRAGGFDLARRSGVISHRVECGVTTLRSCQIHRLQPPLYRGGALDTSSSRYVILDRYGQARGSGSRRRSTARRAGRHGETQKNNASDANVLYFHATSK